MTCPLNAKTVVFTACTLLAASSPANAQEGCCFEPTYRLQCETVMQPQTVQKYRLSYETEYVPQEVTSYRPVLKTRTEQREYKVAKPIVETSYREERYTVWKSVTETTYRDETVTQTKYVSETAEREEQYTTYKPVVETLISGTAIRGPETSGRDAIPDAEVHSSAAGSTDPVPNPAIYIDASGNNDANANSGPRWLCCTASRATGTHLLFTELCTGQLRQQQRPDLDTTNNAVNSANPIQLPTELGYTTSSEDQLRAAGTASPSSSASPNDADRGGFAAGAGSGPTDANTNGHAESACSNNTHGRNNSSSESALQRFNARSLRPSPARCLLPSSVGLARNESEKCQFRPLARSTRLENNRSK